MMTLKTLKDIFPLDDEEDKVHNCIMKQEAIKWVDSEIKNMLLNKDKIPECTISQTGVIEFILPKDMELIDIHQRYSYQNVSQWIYFFNITNEDLKE